MAAAPDLFDADVDQLLVETADELFARHGGPDALRELAGGGWSPELWRHVEEIGLASLGVPADAGGSDGSVAHLASVLRMAGRHAVQLPLASTAIARWALAQAGVPCPDGPLAIAAAGVSGGTVSARRVPHARDCTIVLVADGRVGVVAPHAASISTGTNVAGEPRDDVVTSFDAVAWVAAEGIVEAFELRAALAVAAESAGLLEAVRRLTIEHVKTREQFGVALARFPVVRDRLSLLAEYVAAAGAAVDVARAAIAAGRGEVAVPAAKVATADAAREVARIAHQLHGAIGVTVEHTLQVYTRRLWARRDEAGDERLWARRLGAALVGADAWRRIVEESP